MRYLLRMLACLGLALHAPFVPAQIDIKRVEVQFAQGTSAARVSGTLKGSEIVDYTLRARAGQSLAVTIRPSNPSANFNVLPPDSQTSIFTGSVSGNRFDGLLPVDGAYTVRVYLMRNAARRNETARYTLDIGIDNAHEQSANFDRNLTMHGVSFHVTSTSDGDSSILHIVPNGLSGDNTPIVRTVPGVITGAEVADLNVDRSPEVYVYFQDHGVAARGRLVAYAANRRKSLTGIHLTSIADDPALSQGYRGHDEFAVIENALAQRFPIYRDGDADDKATGGMRQMQYKLVQGEAGWILKLQKTTQW